MADAVLHDMHRQRQWSCQGPDCPVAAVGLLIEPALGNQLMHRAVPSEQHASEVERQVLRLRSETCNT